MLWTRFVVGYHGCDAALANRIVCRDEHLTPSLNDYDWLGNGIYFWEGSPERALKWAETASARRGTKVHKPGVIGAVIDLGECLNLVEAENLNLVHKACVELSTAFALDNMPLPLNSGEDRRLRKLDCAVFEALHKYRDLEDLPAFDTVRAFFVEGAELYPTAGIRNLDHIQICVRNPKQIIGYFLP